MAAKRKGVWATMNDAVNVIFARCTSVIVILLIACAAEPNLVVTGTVKDATTGQAIGCPLFARGDLRS